MQDESPTIISSFATIKLTRDGNHFTLWHKLSERNSKKVDWSRIEKDGWLWVYSFELIHRDLHYMQTATSLHKMYTVPSQGFFMTFRLMKWVEGRMICIKDNILLIEDENHRVTSKFLEDDKAIVAAAAEFFPEFNTDNDIVPALENWHRNTSSK